MKPFTNLKNIKKELMPTGKKRVMLEFVTGGIAAYSTYDFLNSLKSQPSTSTLPKEFHALNVIDKFFLRFHTEILGLMVITSLFLCYIAGKLIIKRFGKAKK